jgi:uncharacterized protein RhaS with RHS repeats
MCRFNQVLQASAGDIGRGRTTRRRSRSWTDATGRGWAFPQKRAHRVYSGSCLRPSTTAMRTDSVATIAAISAGTSKGVDKTRRLASAMLGSGDSQTRTETRGLRGIRVTRCDLTGQNRQLDRLDEQSPRCL